MLDETRPDIQHPFNFLSIRVFAVHVFSTFFFCPSSMFTTGLYTMNYFGVYTMIYFGNIG